RVVVSRTPRKDVADAVDGDGAAGFLTPANEEIAPLSVELSQREAAHAALCCRADLGELHQGGPETVGVDVHRCGLGNGSTKIKKGKSQHNMSRAQRLRKVTCCG